MRNIQKIPFGLGAMLDKRITQPTDGRTDGQIWLDDLECSGNENSIFDCQHRHNTIGSHDCGHGEDVGIDCSR